MGQKITKTKSKGARGNVKVVNLKSDKSDSSKKKGK